MTHVGRSSVGGDELAEEVALQPVAGLDGLVFHELRHAAVALAIANGAHAKAIQQRMGHSSVTVTLDRYGHLLPSLDDQIADGLDRMYRLALAERLGGGQSSSMPTVRERTSSTRTSTRRR